MSEYYAVQRSDEYLAHYGVPGMKWGVRKYLTRSGKETSKSLSRYGSKATKYSSARKIQRDFNNLDKSFANVNAERVDQKARLSNLVGKTIKKGLKYQSKGFSDDQIKSKLEKKYKNKINKTATKIREAEAQMRGIERVQNRVIGTAVKNKYDISGRSIQRLGMSRKDRLVSRTGAFMPGGAITGAIYGGLAAANGIRTGKAVMGNQVKVNKYGTGKVSLANYAALNKKYGGSTPSAPRQGKKRRNRS